MSQSINLKQYEILFALLSANRELVENTDFIENHILYIKKLLDTFDSCG